MEVERGQIWWADLPDPVASEPGYRRPLLIVQANEFNQSAIQTVLAIALTSNLSRAEAPGNVLLPVGKTGLPKDSVANVSQVVTIDKRLLKDPGRLLDGRLMESIDNGLRLVLALT